MPTFTQIITPPELRDALIQFARDFNPNYFMTPCFNRKEISIEAAKRMLQVFVRRLCEHFFGKKYMQNPLIKDFNGVVFIEKPKKELHFHIPLYVPPQIESKFKAYAEKLWRELFQGGDNQCKMIMSDSYFRNATGYSAKDSLIPLNYENWCTLCMLYTPSSSK
jgi:hypothetical protein